MARLVLLTFLLVPFLLKAQTRVPYLTFAKVDSLSYAYYLAQDLKSLKELTNEALKHNIDFFYLRTRLAITAYNQKNYDLAYKHFLAVAQKVPQDTIIQEYIYYALALNFRAEDAYLYAKKLSSAMQEKLQSNRKQLSQLTLQAGSLITPQVNPDQNKKGKPNIYAEGLLNESLTYENVVLQVAVKKRNQLRVGFSNYNSNAIGFVQTSTANKNQNLSNQQIQLDGYFQRHFSKGCAIGLGASFYALNYAYFTSTYKPIEGYTYKNITNQWNGYSALLNVTKRFSYTSIGVQYSTYNLNNTIQHQLSGSLLFYPLGNTKFTVGAGISETLADQNNFVFNVSSSYMPFKWMQMSGVFYSGNMKNYIVNTGTITYNTSDPILNLLNIKTDFYYKKIIVSPSYTFQTRQSSYVQYTNSNTYHFEKTNYITHFINLSLTWKL